MRYTLQLCPKKKKEERILTVIQGLSQHCAPFPQFCLRLGRELVRCLPRLDHEVALGRFFLVGVEVFHHQNRARVSVQRYAALVARLGVVHVDVDARFCFRVGL